MAMRGGSRAIRARTLLSRAATSPGTLGAATLFLLSISSIVLCVAIPASSSVDSNPNEVFAFSVVFGDSFTDYNNMYHHRGQPGPPWFAPGRDSNGDTWIQVVSNQTQLENLNMAWQGSVTDQLVHSLCPSSPNMTQTCRGQVDEYLDRYAKGLPGTQLYPSNRTGDLSTLTSKDAPSRILYFMACGVVDLITAFAWNCWDQPNSMQLPKLIADTQFHFLEQLYNRTNARDFLLVNIFPTWRGVDPSNPRAQKAMSDMDDATNAAFTRNAALFLTSHPDAQLEIVDWYAALTSLYLDPSSDLAKSHFGTNGANMYSPCLQGDTDSNAVVVCKDPDSRFFWDGHFSAAGHRYLANVTRGYVGKMVERRKMEGVATGGNGGNKDDNKPQVGGAGKAVEVEVAGLVLSVVVLLGGLVALG